MSTGENEVVVMLVDDDPAIVKLTSRLLSSMGYVVCTAGNGNAALGLYRERKDEIKVVLTDMQMPDLSGRELADQLHADQPTLPIIFVSGYAQEQVSQGTEADHIYFIQKPFNKARLASVVNTALGLSV